jgi:CubicO group peptidase (beta-lactamase class C family)
MKKLLGILVLGLFWCNVSLSENEKCKSLTKYSNNWYYNNCDKQNSKVKTWGRITKIPEEYKNPNLETLRYHFLTYNKRGKSYKFYTEPSSQPTALKFNLKKKPKFIKKIVKNMQSTGLISYLMYENGEIVIDQLSPPERFGDLIDNDTMIYSMSLGKSLGGYLIGHAICKGYINSLSSTLADWPIVKGTLLETATVQDLINASTGDQKYIKDNYLSSGRDIGDLTIASITKNELANTKPAKKRFKYSQFSPNVALNYISFKTGYKFSSFMNEVLNDHVGLAGKLKMNHIGTGIESEGGIQSNFKASRYDYLRIGIAILNHWNSDTCIGNYLKDVYANRVNKGYIQGDGYSKSYAGFFHTNYSGISDAVMGMDGYGGIALLINFDDNRIVYTHAVHRNYNYKSLVLKAVDKGKF